MNRTLRFVLFVSQVQWFQAFTGLFRHWSHAIAQGKGPIPRRMEYKLKPCPRAWSWSVPCAPCGPVAVAGGVIDGK